MPSSPVLVYAIELRIIFYRKKFHKLYPCTHVSRAVFRSSFLGLEEAEKRKEFFSFLPRRETSSNLSKLSP